MDLNELKRFLELAEEWVKTTSAADMHRNVLDSEMRTIWEELPLNQRVYAEAILSPEYHPIKPPAYAPTEREHQMAYQSWCLTTLVYDVLMPYHMVMRGDFKSLGLLVKDGFKSREEQEQAHLDSYLNDMFGRDRERGRDEEAWECLWHVEHDGKKGFEAFKSSRIEYLNSEHCGDCTYVARSCARCWAESLYGIPGTARRWGSGREGNRLLHEWKESLDNK